MGKYEKFWRKIDKRKKRFSSNLYNNNNNNLSIFHFIKKDNKYIYIS